MSQIKSCLTHKGAGKGTVRSESGLIQGSTQTSTPMLSWIWVGKKIYLLRGSEIKSTCSADVSQLKPSPQVKSNSDLFWHMKYNGKMSFIDTILLF